MSAPRRLLAPAPPTVTPERVALAAVGVLALAVTPALLTTNDGVRHELGGSGAATAFTVLTTAALSVLLARRALKAATPRGARLHLVLGGCLAGALGTLLVHAGLVVFFFGARPGTLGDWLETVLIGSIFFGMPVGGLLGIMFAPAIVAATRARLSPSLDAVDRVLFATGASLLPAGAVWLFGSASLSSAAPLAAAGVVGVLAVGSAGVRLVARVRFLERARAGVEPGFRVAPLAGSEEEAALLPLVRTWRPGGVLVASGAAVPYRGERGAVRLALVPLPGAPFPRPVAGLVRGALAEVANTVSTLAVVLSTAAILCFLFLLWAFRGGFG